MDYKIGNIKNFSKTKDWICGHFVKEGILENENLEVKVSTMQPGFVEPEHFHPHGTEVVIIMEGEWKYQLNGKEYILKSGDFVFMKNQVKEAILEVIKPTTYIVVRTPSVENNKTYT